MSLQGPFSPAGWASSYSKDHAPSWAPDPDGSALGQLGTFLGCESRWKTIRQAFMKSDNDGNGVITRDELEIMCRDMGLSAEVGAGLLNEFDMDENGEWNYHEFCDVLRKQDYITYSQCIPREQYPNYNHEVARKRLEDSEVGAAGISGELEASATERRRRVGLLS